MVNATIDLGSSVMGNDQCSQVYVALFNGAGTLTNVTIVGTINLINVAQSTNINTFLLSKIVGDADGFTANSNVSSNLIFQKDGATLSNGTASGITTTIYNDVMPGGTGTVVNAGNALTIANLAANSTIIAKTPTFYNVITNVTTTKKIYTGNYTLVNPYNDYYLNAYLEYLAV